MILDVGAKAKSEIRAAAVKFAKRFENAESERGEAQTFWNEFFEVFGIPRRLVGLYELAADRHSTGRAGRIDLFVANEMAVEHKSRGESLTKAMGQLIDYDFPKAEMPWLLVVCDFARFRWHNLETGEFGEFLLEELVDNVELFWWIAGYARPDEEYGDEEEVNLKATALVTEIHDLLLESGYDSHALREWLTRLVFCLFADDTGVWDHNLFTAWISAKTAEDGSDLGGRLQEIFEVLNTPGERRQAFLPSELKQLTYVNGDIFSERLPIPACNQRIRDALLAACRFDWSAISPAIFGSMFQNVMTPVERRQLGAHYTSEENILRTIRPLFLDDLEAELAKATSLPKINAFLEKLSDLTFFDPACGCGNFLVVAYREIRDLEKRALRERMELLATRQYGQGVEQLRGQLALDIAIALQVRVDQFYGIEIEEWPAKIARTALYLADHLANREASAEFGEQVLRFPIPASPHIVHADALEFDWNDVLSSDDCDFCFGNPPFAGHRYRSGEQSDQMRALWGRAYTKSLDYVTCWYRVAVEYGRGTPCKFAFVSTNSISQGEQVAPLWSVIAGADYGIDFAHSTFAWTNDASGLAHVHVVIIGFAQDPPRRKRLFTYTDLKGEPECATVTSISPYLTEGPLQWVERRTHPLSPAMPPVNYGSLPNDGGGLVIDPDELPTGDPVAMKYVRSYLGSRELLNGNDRYVLWMPDGPDPGDLANSQFLKDRLAAVRDARRASSNPDANALADTPYRFFHNGQPEVTYIGIPAQSSSTRLYYPVALLGPNVIASNTLYTAEDPDGFLFGILSSSMMLSWLAGVGGKIKSDFRYAKKIVHNTFPLPATVSASKRQAVIDAGAALREARPPDVPLAHLYEPLAMPTAVVQAHRELDRAVNAMLAPRKRRLDTHEDRLGVLLELYHDATTIGQLVEP